MNGTKVRKIYLTGFAAVILHTMIHRSLTLLCHIKMINIIFFYANCHNYVKVAKVILHIEIMSTPY